MQIGQKIIRLDTVNSTNNYTANLVKEGKIVHGTVILADEQTAGRGQRGAIWLSNAGENMLFSVFLSPDNLSVKNQVALTHFTSLCLVEILRKIGISASIKWPNDIYVSDKKIAGILIENTISGDRIANSIIGIGLNVNQMNFENVSATSIQSEKSEFVSIESLLFMLLFEMNLLWEHLEKGDLELLRSKYLEKMYLLNQQATFEDQEGVFVGKITGISEAGLLKIEKEIGVKMYDLKEIKFISQNAF